MEKLLVMYAAAQLAHASAGNASAAGNLPINAEITDPNVRAKNLMVWEDFRIFYHAIVKALADDDADTGWPAPKINLASLLNTDVLGSVIQKLQGAVPTIPTPAIAPHLPDPGK